MPTPLFNIDLNVEDPKWIIPGPSSLYYMASGFLVFESPYRFAIPDNLIKLLERVEQGSEDHAEFLVKIVTEDHPEEERLSANTISSYLRSILADLEGLGRLVMISGDMVDPEIEDAIADSFGGGDYEISLSPKSNFMRDYFKRALSWSKKTGAVIIETTRSRFVGLGEHIVSLQLPKKADAVIKDKQEFIGRVFNFPGGKATKWFVGLSISVGGLAFPPLGAIGVGIAFVDP